MNNAVTKPELPRYRESVRGALDRGLAFGIGVGLILASIAMVAMASTGGFLLPGLSLFGHAIQVGVTLLGGAAVGGLLGAASNGALASVFHSYSYRQPGKMIVAQEDMGVEHVVKRGVFSSYHHVPPGQEGERAGSLEASPDVKVDKPQLDQRVQASHVAQQKRA